MNRLTIRTRLTLLYTALFTAAGVFMLGVTYVLVDRQLPQVASVKVVGGAPTGFEPIADKIEFANLLNEKAAAFRDGTLTTLLTQGGVALLCTILIAAAFAYLIAGQALQSLQQITETAGRIARDGTSGRGLHERIALKGPQDEVRRLADTFDQMLARLDHSFDVQRRFVANASHELRTPLALNRALVELAITRTGASQDAQQLGEALLRVNERHERLIEGLLMLADSESEIVERAPINLADVVTHVLDQQPPDKAATRLLDPAVCSGDPVLLERLVQNLVENATKHNVAKGGWIRVQTSTVDGRARLTITNTGPMVPTYELETIFQPFRRLTRERTNRGLGLGLSIVRAIATAHGGTVTASSRPSGGLVLTVNL